MQSVSLCTSSFPVLNITSLKPLRKINLGSPILWSQGRRSAGISIADVNNKKAHNVSVMATRDGGSSTVTELDENVRKILQSCLWTAEGVYIIWLFLLPYAPGDPVWAISKETISSLIGLSLNFLFILPMSNAAGIHLIEAPVLHPISESLFNFVIGWTLMFAPVLYTDKRNDRFKGSIDVLWGFQMFLTNTFLIPYMAIRLNKEDIDYSPRKSSQLGSLMTGGASVIGIIGGLSCLLSIWWAICGRGDGNYGDLHERWEYLVSYLGSERLAYAFIWDICLYIIFQPWLILDNLENIPNDKLAFIKFLAFVPVIGLVAYCLCLDVDNEI